MQTLRTPHLPDLLDHLPLDVVDTNVWRLVAGEAHAPSPGCGALRQACRQTLGLVDSLITTLSLCDTKPDASDSSSDEGDEEEELEAWHQAATQRAAFLARLPRLTSLQLTRWPHEAALATLLARYGDATGGRLRELKLCGRMVGVAACGVLRSACPNLSVLDISCSHLLSGDVLLTLHKIPTLTSLTLDGDCEVSTDALRSLGALTGLRHVEFRMTSLLHDQLQPLSRLRSLRHCCVDIPDTPTSLVDVSALFALSCLTHLELPNVAHNGTSTQTDGSIGDVPTAGAAGERMARAAAALGGLSHLHSLAFGCDFDVGDVAWPALRRLTRLTSLHVGCIRVTAPQPGHLPALQRLVLRSATPSHLLQGLLPLLPLAALETLTLPVPDGVQGIVSVRAVGDGADGFDTAVESAALRQAATCLGAAPRLALPCLRISWDGPVLLEEGVPRLSLLQVADGLQPLSGKLHYLELLAAPAAGAEYAHLGARLICVEDIVLLKCTLTDTSLTALASRWASLQSLCVENWPGVNPDGWLAMAAGRADPLIVQSLDPSLSPAEVLQCQEVQVSVFGKNNLDFM